MTFLTARTIADACRDNCVAGVIVPGGGAENPTLMEMLARRTAGTAVTPIDELGVPAAFKEAYFFALIGFLTINGSPATCLRPPGRRTPVVLGCVLPGRAGFPVATAATIATDPPRNRRWRERMSEPVLVGPRASRPCSTCKMVRSRWCEESIWTLAPGRPSALVGESGCGKSMTMLSVMGLHPQPPAEIVGGEVMLDGRDLLAMNEEERRAVRGAQLAMVYQDPMTSLNPLMRIGDQIAEVLLAHGRSRRDAEATNGRGAR